MVATPGAHPVTLNTHTQLPGQPALLRETFGVPLHCTSRRMSTWGVESMYVTSNPAAFGGSVSKLNTLHTALASDPASAAPPPPARPPEPALPPLEPPAPPLAPPAPPLAPELPPLPLVPPLPLAPAVAPLPPVPPLASAAASAGGRRAVLSDEHAKERAADAARTKADAAEPFIPPSSHNAARHAGFRSPPEQRNPRRNCTELLAAASWVVVATWVRSL